MATGREQRRSPSHTSVNRLLDVLVFSRLYLALIAGLEVIIVLVFLGAPVRFPPVIATALLTFSVYANDQLVDLDDDDISDPAERRFIERHRNLIYVFASVSYGVALGLTVLGGVLSFAVALFPGIAWIAYASDLMRTITGRVGIGFGRIKELFLFNTSLVAVTWALAVVVLPLGFVTDPSMPTVAVLLLYFFLRVFTNTETANIPDHEEDVRLDIETLPTRLGISGFRRFVHVVDAVTVVLVVVAVLTDSIPTVFAVPLLAGVAYSTVVTAGIGKRFSGQQLTRLGEFEYVTTFCTLIGLVALGAISVSIPIGGFSSSGLTLMLMLSTWIGMSVGLLAWREHPTPGALPLVLMLFGQVLWSATLFLEIGAEPYWLKLALAELRWLGIAVIPIGWFLFAAEYTGRVEYVEPKYILGLSVVPALTVLFAVTGPYNTLLYQDSTLIRVAGTTLLSRTPGPWFWVITGYVYLVGAAGALMLLRLIEERLSTFYTGQIAALLVGLMAPVVSNALFLTGRVPIAGLDPTPLSFGVSGLAYLGAITRLKLLDGSPTPSPDARNMAFEEMEQAAVVVDRSDFVVDLNDAAAELLQTSVDAALGRQAGNILPEYDEAIKSGTVDDQTVVDVDDRSLEYSVTSVEDFYDRPVCSVITINNVSAYVRRQQQLRVLHRAFRHNVRTQGQLMLGNIGRIEDEDVGDTSAIGDLRDNLDNILSIGDKMQDMVEVFESDNGRDGIRLDQIVSNAVNGVDCDGVDVIVSISDDAETVRVDRVVEFTLRNALENAVEHNTSAQPRVEIDIAVDEGRAHIETRDNGPGLSDYETDVLRDCKETKLEHTSGIGMWIMVWGTDIAGGQLTFRENEPTGTVLTVEVPTVSGAVERGPGASVGSFD